MPYTISLAALSVHSINQSNSYVLGTHGWLLRNNSNATLNINSILRSNNYALASHEGLLHRVSHAAKIPFYSNHRSENYAHKFFTYLTVRQLCAWLHFEEFRAAFPKQREYFAQLTGQTTLCLFHMEGCCTVFLMRCELIFHSITQTAMHLTHMEACFVIGWITHSWWYLVMWYKF